MANETEFHDAFDRAGRDCVRLAPALLPRELDPFFSYLPSITPPSTSMTSGQWSSSHASKNEGWYVADLT